MVFRVFWGILRKYLNFAGPRPREISSPESRTLHCNTLKAGYTVLTGKKVIVLIYDYQNFLYHCSIVSLHCTCNQSHVVRDGPYVMETMEQWCRDFLPPTYSTCKTDAFGTI